MTTKSKQATPTQDSEEQLNTVLARHLNDINLKAGHRELLVEQLIAWRDQEVMKAKEQWHKDQRLAQWKRNALAGNGDDAKRLEDL